MDTANKKHYLSNNGGIDKLPDDILINILSRLDNIKEASRTSVLARRWRYLWRFSHGILRFDNWDTAMGREEFNSFVNTVVELHQGPNVEGVSISFDSGRDLDYIKSNSFHGADTWLWVYYKWSLEFEKWVFFASRKQVQSLELNLSLHDGYKFPILESLMSISDGATSPLCCLRTLRLAYVDVEDEVVQYFLVSCPNLEELRVRFAYATKNLQVIDPPSLRVLEISRCFNMQSLEISVADLVSLTYGGRKRSLHLKKIPNLGELNICDDFCTDFIVEPKEHWSYSIQLEKLVLDFRLLYQSGALVVSDDLPRICSLKRLEVQVLAEAGRDLLFVTTLIKASPQLSEFRIEMFHTAYPVLENHALKTFPGVETELSNGVIVVPKVGKYAHKNLKAVDINGYIGCLTDEKLVKALIQIGRPSLERVAIDTKSDYYDSPELQSFISFREKDICKGTWFPPVGAMTRYEAKERARKLVSKFPRRIKFIVT